MSNCKHWSTTSPLYAITDPDLGHGRQLVHAVAAAIRGGASVIQFRDKFGSLTDRHQAAYALAKVCREHSASLIINDDVQLAATIPEAGVHLGADDETCFDARQHLGADRIIGLSCYDSLVLAFEAVAAGADYVAFGSVFPSSTKPHAVHAPLALLQRARNELSVPIIAIGGIKPDNARSVIAAGATKIAVISGIFKQPDPEQAARQYMSALASDYLIERKDQ